MNDADHILTFDTFEDIDLYELSETARNEDYKKLAGWISRYKQRQISEHNKRCDVQKKREYEHEFHVLLGLIDSVILKTSKKSEMTFKGFVEVRRIKRRIKAISNEIFNHIAIGETARNRLKTILKKNKFTDNFKSFLIENFKGDDRSVSATDDAGSVFPQTDKSSELVEQKLNEFIEKMFKGKQEATANLTYIDPDQYLPAYESRLNNHIFLLEELVDILNTEYDRRVISTKTRFEEYLLPRKRVLEKIDDEIEEIADDLKFLSEDENIGEDDREKLKAAFSNKKEELKVIKTTEFEKLESIKLVSENIKNGVSLFRELIDNLRKKLRYFKKREFYVEKLARYGAEIPKLKNVLDVLYTTFNSEIKKLQKSFLLFDISFQKTIFNAIDDQSIINRIILSPKGIIDAELAIESPVKPSAAHKDEDFSEREKKVVDGIEDDLSFLKPYEEK